MKNRRWAWMILTGLSFFFLGAKTSLVGENGLQKLSGATFVVDLRYHTSDNFLKKDVYGPRHLDSCWVVQELRAALLKLVPELRKRHLKLVFWDCFRPLSIQRQMWKLVPDSRYVANPDRGSNHNRGAAIDVTLAQEGGALLPMPTTFDSFEPRAFANYRCSTKEELLCEDRALLSHLMKGAGLVGLRTEWWHFQLPDAKKYPLRD